MTTRSRRGMTLIEILVACIVSVLALGATYYLFRQSRGTVSSTEDRLSVLHHGQLLIEQFKRDLACLYFRKDDLQTTIDITADGASFCRAVDLLGRTPTLTRVTYGYNMLQGTVTREGTGFGRTVYGTDAVKVKKFEVKLVRSMIGGRETGRIDVTFTMAKMGGGDRAELTLTDRIFPASLQSSGIGWKE